MSCEASTFICVALARIDDGEPGLDCGQVGNVISAAAKNFALGLRWGSFSDTANNRPSAH